MKDAGNSPLPPDRMPSCWSDEQRINVLFSPFRNRSANPQDWTSKYRFWKELIEEWLRYEARCSFTLAILTDRFRKEGRTPHCLRTVVQRLLEDAEIVPESEFSKEPSRTWTEWSLDAFVKKPLSWSLSKMKSFVVEPEVPKDTRYVHLRAAEELGDSVFSVLERTEGRVLLPFSDILEDCARNINDSVTDNSVRLALVWLKRRNRIAYKTAASENELLVKIISEPAEAVTDVEEGLYLLTKREDRLAGRIRSMEEEKSRLTAEARACLSAGTRQLAKVCLRKKMQLEKAIEKRARALATLQGLIIDIENSRENACVVSAYKTGSEVLKRIAEMGSNESDVAEVTDNLREALDEQKEVQRILSTPLDNSGSDAELEEELARLIADDEPPVAMGTSDVEGIALSLQNLSIEDPSPTKSAVGDPRKKKEAMPA